MEDARIEHEDKKMWNREEKPRKKVQMSLYSEINQIKLMAYEKVLLFLR